jgi:hypothetical protein
MPSWIKDGNFSRSELIAILRNHVTKEVTHWRGKIAIWDVVNEAVADDGTLRNSFWYNKIGPEFIDYAFQAARAADPGAKLYYNEYGAEAPGPKATRVFNLVKDMKARGIPIDGVGLQAHFTLANAPTVNEMTNVMNKLTGLGVEVGISELDVRIDLPATATELSKQADAYKRVLDACKAVSRCVSITTWGFTDRYSWIPGFFNGKGAALPYDENFNPKPAANVLNGQYRTGPPPPLPAPPCNAPSYTHALVPGQCLRVGQSLRSQNGQYVAVLQSDGNFVIYGPSGPTWSSETYGVPAYELYLQGDGNMVIYGPNGATWWTSTNVYLPDLLIMQDDGNLVLYARGRAVWARGYVTYN